VTPVDADWQNGSTETAEGLAGWRARERGLARPRAAAQAPRPRKFFARAFGLLAAVGLGISVLLVLPLEKASVLAAPGGMLTAAGRVTALAGTYLMLVTLLLIGRIPAIERAVGQDKLVRLHRRLGPWVLILVGAHVALITIGYAIGVKTGFFHELATMVVTYPGMLMAAVGFGLLLMAGLTSYRYAREKLRYETWWAVHLYTYLGAALSVPHQVFTGAPFLGHPLARAFWLSLWAMTAGVVLGYRWGLPMLRSLRHQIRVVAVQEESPGVVSLVLRGRRLDRLPVDGGQFMQWRFLRRGLWWQAHPYSLSALPSATQMRITVKQLGDHSSGLASVPAGTCVAIEGPYGAFTKHARKTDRVLLIGAGVGATPLRALLDDLPSHVDVVTILRGSSAHDLVLREEIAQVVGERGGRLHEVVGPRSQAPLDAAALRRLVPDIHERDLYVCGPSAFMHSLVADARSLGVPASRIHFEEFAF
jgi:predicted ferric reductase